MLKNKSTQKGFTLIEMLVSIALFSVVLTVTIGTIVTISDSNKKSRSLMSVTNNLNFSIDSMTRSLKAGQGLAVSNNGTCVQTEEIIYRDIRPNDQFPRQSVIYCHSKSGTNPGVITKQIENGAPVPLTSPDIDVEYLKFVNQGHAQPFVMIHIEGTAKISERVTSKFNIQTSVSQRQLSI